MKENVELEKAKKVFSGNLKKYMKLAHKEQADIVNEFGITASTVSDWYNGKKYPRIDKVQKLADWLGILKSDLTENKSEINIVPITGSVPILGVIPAGVPIFAEENIEGYMPVTVKNPEEYFCLRVHGKSMINAGIPDGATVLVHQQPCAEDGQIVACRVNGDEATLKRFKRVKGSIILMPENPDFQPILVNGSEFDNGYAQILGVVKQIIIDI